MSYQPGGIAAPDYGRPPKKSRAGVFIALMLVLLVAVLGTGVWVATKVVGDIKPSSDDAPPPAPITSVAPRPTAVKPKPTKPVKTVPVKPVPITPAAVTPAQIAARFVSRLNANDVKGATALQCANTTPTISLLIGQFIHPPTALTASKAPVTSGGGVAVFSLSGTMKGAPAGGVLVVQVGSGRPCMQAFQVH